MLYDKTYVMNGKQLKNSILQWAIQGKLVTQDPNDEPASVLLDKIRQEKERLIKEKKIKRDKNASIIYRGEDNSYYEKLLATGEVKCIDEEIPFEVPKGWEWCRISSLFQINPKVVAEDNTSAAFIPMEAISAGYGSEFRYYEKEWGEIKSGYTAFADNDIAFAKITPCFQNRKSAIFEGLPNGIGAGTTELKILRTYGETINRWFVLYFLESPYFIDEATFKGTANQQRIIVGYLENKLFPLPPLAEQERIVDKIGLVMPIIDKYSKSQELLDKMNVELNECLKKSVLQEAIQGKLVPQIAEEGTAQELLEQIKTEKQKLVKEGKLKKEDNLEWYFVVRFLAATGARVSELVQIKVEHVQVGYYDIYTKGGKIRRIYIPKTLRTETEKWLQTLNRTSGYLFLNRFGERITTRGISQQLKNYAVKYGLNEKVVYPHSFRHRYAKNFLEKFNDIALLADLMGHESIETTRIYLRRSSLEQQEIVDKVITW